jgi:hypothetical protein
MRLTTCFDCFKFKILDYEIVKYNVFLFDEPLKGPKSLKIFKISLMFCFDKLWHLSKSVHAGENSQIPTVSNKKYNYNSRQTDFIVFFRYT